MIKELLPITATAFCACLMLTTTACTSDALDESATENTVSRATTTMPQFGDLSVKYNTENITIGCTLTGLDGYKLSLYGFSYSKTNPQPGWGSAQESQRKSVRNINETGYFSTDIKLTIDQRYWIRAYAVVQNTTTQAKDTIYGEPIEVQLQKQLPTLETLPVTNRARLGACVFAKFTGVGNQGLSKWGVCYSTSHTPTANGLVETARDTCKTKGYEGEFGVFLQQLQPKTLYHVRAFAITANKDTVYGQERIFRTTLGGRYSWHWARNYEGAVAAGAAERISVAMDSAAYYYNNYSNLYLSASVEYNEGVQTADCSYGGWIRFGKVERYQWVGTAQHETAHGLGVGTAWNWQTLLNYNGDRIWTGKCAQRTLRAVMHDQTQNLKGDGMHMWPGGINQREEVTNGTSNSYGESIKNERMLRSNAMICNALQIDGLACP